MKRFLIIIVSLLLTINLFYGCNIETNDGPDIHSETAIPSETESSTSVVSPDASPVNTEFVTEVPATEAPTEEPTEVPTDTPSPEPTEVPTPRPSADDLKFVNYLDKESGSVRDLCYFSDDAEPGYKDNVLANIFDSDDRTYWSVLNNNLDLTLDFNFKVPVYINRLDTWWYTLYKIYYYKVSVKLAGSDEFVEVVDRTKNTVSDETTDNINIGPVEVVRYHFYDNNMLNKWVQFAELYIRGMTFTSEEFEIDYVRKIIRIPEQMDHDEFLAKIKFIGTYKVWIGYEPDNTGTVTDSSILRVSCKDAKDDFLVEYIRP